VALAVSALCVVAIVILRWRDAAAEELETAVA
jgi:hypothetical protein